MIRFLSSVFLIAVAAPVAGDEVALPPGEVFGGFVEDDGTIVLLSKEKPDDDGTVYDRDSTILRIAPGGKIESFELPNVGGVSLRRLADGRLLLEASLPPPTPKDYYGVRVHRIIELRAGGRVRQLWEWSEYPTDGSGIVGGSDWLPFEVSPDGKLWGVVRGVLARRGGEPLYGRSGGYDITVGRTRKNAVWRGARNARTISLRFDEVDTLWNEEYWPGWTILDSEGPVIALSWKDEDLIAHCAEECSYTVPLFGQPEERREAWQASDRILWSSTKGLLRAYHLWDFGLSGRSATEPVWEVDRKGGWNPHPERGVFRVVQGKRGYRLEHLWREPWTGLEEHYVSDWQPGTAPPSSAWVSPNGRHAAVLETRQLEEDEGGGVAFTTRSVDMRWEPRPLPPVEAAEPPADDNAEPAKKQAPPAGR